MIAVSAWFDERAEGVVHGVWRQLAEAGVDDSLHAGPYRPHLTLGVWDDVPLEAVAPLVAAVPAFPVTFRAVGIFPGCGSDPDRAASFIR